MAIAFFDLDKTLLSLNSGSLWIRRELRLGHISRWQAIRAAWWVTRYQLGISSMGDTLEKAISQLAGTSMESVRERTRTFYVEEVRSLFRRGARIAVEQHRQNGDKLALLTASSIYLAELVREELQLDVALCNRFEVDAQGIHTGKSVGPVCFGAGKVEHAERYALEHGVPLSDCTFYTDSYFDLPVLLRVGRPVVVHPDRRLARLAQKHEWQIVDWGEPDSALEDVLSVAR